MNRALVIIAVSLISYAGELHACRPRWWTPEQLATAGSVILVSEITSNDGGTITLRTMKTLKGKAPERLVTEANQIYGWADGCMVINEPTWARTHGAGQKWILVGDIKGSQFVAAAPAYEADLPESAELLKQIQRHVQKVSSKRVQ